MSQRENKMKVSPNRFIISPLSGWMFLFLFSVGDAAKSSAPPGLRSSLDGSSITLKNLLARVEGLEAKDLAKDKKIFLQDEKIASQEQDIRSLKAEIKANKQQSADILAQYAAMAEQTVSELRHELTQTLELLTTARQDEFAKKKAFDEMKKTVPKNGTPSGRDANEVGMYTIPRIVVVVRVSNLPDSLSSVVQQSAENEGNNLDATSPTTSLREENGDPQAQRGLATSPSLSTIRINCGGPARLGFQQEDTAWLVGKLMSARIGGADIVKNGLYPESIYTSNRQCKSPICSYQIPAVNGRYFVKVHFAELHFNSEGSRVFDVSIQGQPALSGFDVFAKAGLNTQFIHEGVYNVDAGNVTIQLEATQGTAMISAIEILPATGCHSRVDGDNFVFEGCNVHINNGEASTTSVNGKGNLVLGHNECPSGNCVRTGSHNLVVGEKHSYNSYSGIVSGVGHTIQGKNSAAIGGPCNNKARSRQVPTMRCN